MVSISRFYTDTAKILVSVETLTLVETLSLGSRASKIKCSKKRSKRIASQFKITTQGKTKVVAAATAAEAAVVVAAAMAATVAINEVAKVVGTKAIRERRKPATKKMLKAIRRVVVNKVGRTAITAQEASRRPIRRKGRVLRKTVLPIQKRTKTVSRTFCTRDTKTLYFFNFIVSF